MVASSSASTSIATKLSFWIGGMWAVAVVCFFFVDWMVDNQVVAVVTFALILGV